jgi:1,5-anhydro-D-fructose reductase (1,5-anhydro-D-mannitol-forming)
VTTAIGSRSRTLRWALIGASTIAANYMVRAIREAPGGSLMGIVSGDPTRAARFAREHAIPHTYSSLQELCSDDEIDVVYVSSINALHAPATLAAAQAGKHVLCEKPLAPTVDVALAMVAACQQAAVVLGVNHDLRCAPAHESVRELVANGDLGRVLAARTFHPALLAPELRRWRTKDAAAGGGAALDITVHDVDLLRYLLADEVVEVLALTGVQGVDTVNVEDSVAGALRFGRGTIATFHDSLALPFAQTSLTLHGELGGIDVIDAMADDPIAAATLTDSRGVREIPTRATPGLYHASVTAFNAAVRGDGQPRATGEDGLRAVEIVTAALESARSGRSISLSPRPL